MTTIELDFDALMAQFNEILSHIVNAVDEEVFAASWQPRITQIIEKYLGRGVKVSQCSREQVEALDLIVTELRDIMPS
jgi:hypothetical protein